MILVGKAFVNIEIEIKKKYRGMIVNHLKMDLNIF